MIIDALNEFFNGQSLAANATSKVIDFGNRGIGATYIPVLIQITEDAAGAGTAKVTFESSDTKDFTVTKEMASTAAIPAADLKAGYRFPIRIMPKTNQRWIRAKLVIAGLTGGKIEVAVVADVDDNKE